MRGDRERGHKVTGISFKLTIDSKGGRYIIFLNLLIRREFVEIVLKFFILETGF